MSSLGTQLCLETKFFQETSNQLTYCGSTEFNNQNLRQIVQGGPTNIKRPPKQSKISTLYK